MQFLSQTETNEILSVLKGGVDKTFESVTLSIGLLFRREIDKFKACCGLVFVMVDGFLDPRQRLFALYALLELHRDKAPGAHPFWEFLLSLGTDGHTPSAEMELIHLFIVQNRGAELQRRSINDFLTLVHSTSTSVLLSHQNELHQLRIKLPIHDKGIGVFAKGAIHQVILKDEEKTQAEFSIPREQQIKVFGLIGEELGLSGFQPCFVRPSPPLGQPLGCEMQWLSPRPTVGLMWDCGRDNEMEILSQELKELLSKAMKSQLLPTEQHELLQSLKSNPKVIFHCEVDPSMVPTLVESSPSIVIEILRQLIPSPHGVVYLTRLASLDMSLHSMQVVNDLVTSISIPSEIVHEYLSNCIASCNAIEDQLYQHRQVRLLCVFIQSLMRTEKVDIADLVHEIQAFCVDHARIREASELFKNLRDMEKSQDLHQNIISTLGNDDDDDG